jgi:hypothetical protein
LKEHLVGVYRGVKAARTFQFDQVSESQGSTEALFGSHVRPLIEKVLKVSPGWGLGGAGAGFKLGIVRSTVVYFQACYALMGLVPKRLVQHS